MNPFRHYRPDGFSHIPWISFPGGGQLSWGPYLWANGDRPRKDGFVFGYDDFRENDRMHHSAAGVRKMGTELLKFFKTDETSKPWFVKL